MRSSRIALVWAVGWLAACGLDGELGEPPERGEAPELGEAEQPLLNGTVNTLQSLNAVVLVGGGCTGTLIGERHVLTSGHCLSPAPVPGGVVPGVWYPLSPVTISFGPERSAPLFQSSAVAYNQAGYDDIVLVRLAGSVPASVATPIIPLTDLPNGAAPLPWLQSRTFLMAGYGLIEGGVLAPTRRIASATVAEFPFTSFGTLQPNMLRAVGFDCATIQPGDSGSPLIRYDPVTGIWHTVGVAQGVQSCGGRYVVTFGEGGFDSAGHAKPNIGDWLEAAIPVDFVVSGPLGLGCTGPGGAPTVRVPVKNQGLTRKRVWVDAFLGLPAPPQIGTASDFYAISPFLDPGQTQVVSVPIDESWQGQSVWIDVLLDTVRVVAEGNEGNNHAERYAAIPDC